MLPPIAVSSLKFVEILHFHSEENHAVCQAINVNIIVYTKEPVPIRFIKILSIYLGIKCQNCSNKTTA